MTTADHVLVGVGIVGTVAGLFLAAWLLSNGLLYVCVAVGKAKRDRARRVTR